MKSIKNPYIFPYRIALSFEEEMTLPTYTFECVKCEAPYHLVLKISEFCQVKPWLVCDKCIPQSPLKQVHLSAPATNLGWDHQAAGNANKYWGNKPIVDINIPNNDGSNTVIPAGSNSDYT